MQLERQIRRQGASYHLRTRYGPDGDYGRRLVEVGGKTVIKNGNGEDVFEEDGKLVSDHLARWKSELKKQSRARREVRAEA